MTTKVPKIPNIPRDVLCSRDSYVRNRQYGGPANTTSRRSQFGKANVEYFKQSLVEGGVKNIKCIVMSFRVGS